MLEFFVQCGMWRWPLLAISTAIDALIIVNIVRIVRSNTPDDPRVVNSVNSILFWGTFAAVMGFLGQYTGIYNALGAIIRATEISPRMIMTGFRESFTTTLWGMNTLLWSAIAWIVLRAWSRRAGAGAGGPAVREA